MRFKHAMAMEIVFLVGLFSCKNDSEPTNTVDPPNDFIVPLKVGNRRTFSRTILDTLGYISQIDSGTSTIIGDTLIHNERWFITETGGLVTNRNDGYYTMIENVPTLFTKYPATTNEEYRINIGDDTVFYQIGRVVSTDSTITGPLGTLLCYLYEWRWSYGRVSGIAFYAVNKGVIRSEVFQRTQSGREYVAYRFETLSIELH